MTIPKATCRSASNGRGQAGPRYELMDESGLSHARHFKVAVFQGAEKLGEGEGSSKREAEMQAARQALERLDSPPA